MYSKLKYSKIYVIFNKLKQLNMSDILNQIIFSKIGLYMIPN